MDYQLFGKAYFEATGILVSVLNGTEVVYSSLAELLDLPLPPAQDLPFFRHLPRFCSLNGAALCGIIQTMDADWTVILGPVFSVQLTDEVLDQLLCSLKIPKGMKPQLLETLCKLPMMSPAQLGKHISLVYFSLNGRPVDDSEIYGEDGTFIPEDSLPQRIEQLETGALHNSYYYEVAMYQKVREGNPELLKRFFENNRFHQLSEGAMALSPLRHAKNVFIATVSRVGFIGAIPGGLDMERAYQLMDDYIRRVEELSTIEQVANLQYAMVFDFCRRTGENQRPANISSDVWHCMNYIRAHIYQSISVGDVAASLGRSVSYVQKLFRTELNESVNNFITRSKLEEAKTLLVFSEKTLAQISFDLCFSSQPYFQHLFKKHYGVTPAQYRRSERMI